MRSMKSFFGSFRLKKKYFCMLAVMSILSVVILSTYAYFVVSAGDVRASELLVAELSYGITIREDGVTGSNINKNIVSVSAGKKAYFYITVSSVNKIESKYTLAYKTSSGVVPKYTDRTAWGSQGSIKGYSDNTYSKTIRVVIDNTSGVNSASVEFAVYGGYTFNTFDAIKLKDGFYVVPGGYEELLSGTIGRLVDIVEGETHCVTANSGACYYGGGSQANYLQYPENENKKLNLWRIMGTQKVGDKVLAKLVSESTGTTTVANIGTSLTEFYNGLDNIDQVVEPTNQFNCSATGCTSSAYNKIGIISTYEYSQIGGEGSYLKAINPYFALDNADVKNITSSGINITEGTTSSGLRPSIYLQTDVKVGGSGTLSDPYVIRTKGDINLIAYTLNHKGTTETYEWLKQNKVVNEITCEKGTNAEWDYDNNSIKLSNVQVPDYCTIDFKDGYSVSLTAVNGSVTSVSPVSVIHNGKATFTVAVSNEEYQLPDASGISCTGDIPATASISGNTVSINNVKSNQTCTITMDSASGEFLKKILADNPTVKVRGTAYAPFTAIYNEDTTNTIFKATGEDGSTDVYYFAGDGSKVNNWVKFGKDKDGNNLYWRIIRTNADGGIRLLYAGSSNSTGTSVPTMTNAVINSSTAYNSTYNNSMYVGYMYGTTGSLANNRTNGNSSTIKSTIDTWYGQGLNTKTDGTYTYDKYISKGAIYCNDRAYSGTYYATGTAMYYAGYERLVRNYSSNPKKVEPTYVCGKDTGQGTALNTTSITSGSEDKFSANTSQGGNGKLTYPVALMTADEVSYAGGYYANNSPKAYYYLNASGTGSATGSTYWWTMSPYIFSSGYAGVFYVSGSGNPGYLNGNYVFITRGVRPVVSLKSCVSVSGKGTVAEPYIVSLKGSCATKDN